MCNNNFSRPEPQEGFGFNEEADWQEYQEWLDSHDDEHDMFRDDVEADADALRSAGWGTDEDYYDGGYEDFYYEME